MSNLRDAVGTVPGSMPSHGHWSVPAHVVNHLAMAVDDLDVLEIGTGFGEQIRLFAPICRRIVCIDAMYGWVPDVPLDEAWDADRVDAAKVETWHRNVAPATNVELLVGNSGAVHRDAADRLSSGFDVLVVDGCHHPVAAVLADYTNYFQFMRTPHCVIFDDIQSPDPDHAARKAIKFLAEKGLSTEARETSIDPTGAHPGGGGIRARVICVF